LRSPPDCADALDDLLMAVSESKATPDEANLAVSAIVAKRAELFASVELAAKIEKLKAQLAAVVGACSAPDLSDPPPVRRAGCVLPVPVRTSVDQTGSTFGELNTRRGSRVLERAGPFGTASQAGAVSEGSEARDRRPLWRARCVLIARVGYICGVRDALAK
jgi:hypothetical protein